MMEAGYAECGQEFDPATSPLTTIVQTLAKMQDSISHKQEIMVSRGLKGLQVIHVQSMCLTLWPR